MRYPKCKGLACPIRLKRLRHLDRLLMGGLAACSLGLASAAQPPDSRSDAGALGSGSAQTMPYDTAPGASSPTSGGPTMDTSLTGTVSNAAGGLPPNVAPGWKIRVCSERTQVDNLTFRISQPGGQSNGSGRTNRSGRSGQATGKPYGSQTAAEQAEAQLGAADLTALTSDTSSTVQQTAIWSRGAASEIAVPTALRDADRIRIEAVGQKNKDAHVCVLYNDHVARKLNFDEREVATLRKTENGECGC